MSDDSTVARVAPVEVVSEQITAGSDGPLGNGEVEHGQLLERELLELRRALTAELESNQRLRQELARLEAEGRRYREALALLEGEVDTNKNTLSFQLGHLLIHAPKSWQGVRRLPGELLGLHREARRRREAKRESQGSDARTRRHEGPQGSGQRSLEELAERTMKLFLAEGIEAAARFAESAALSDRERAHALTQLAKAIKTSEPARAKSLAERAYTLEPLPFRAKWLAFQLRDAGEIHRPASLVAGLPTTFSLKPSEKARIAEIMGLARVRANLPMIPQPASKAYDPIPDRSLYVAASALPFHVSGYTVRTHELLRAIATTGWRALPVLRPGYPADRGVELAADTDKHVVDDISYRHVPGPHLRRTGLDEFVAAAASSLADTAMRLRPSVIHAASNHVNALPALIAARRLGVPFVYEVRGMWELTAAARNADWEQSERFQLERDLETLVARHADHVLTLTEGLASELVTRGVARERIDILPNSVDPQCFAPRRKNAELMLRFGLNASSFTLVYAGSLLSYEGLDDLVRAVAVLTQEGFDVTLVMAGDGEARESLQRLAADLGIERRVKLLGRLQPREIPYLWSLADAAAFPRKPFQVCELVSPLKPLEPMAMAIPVVVSDVAALREMVRDGETGLVHRAGDHDSLADRLRLLVQDAGLRARLGEAARKAILEERTWQVAGARVVALYKRLQLIGAVEPLVLAPGRSSMTLDQKALFEARLVKAYELGGAGAVADLAERQAADRGQRLLAFCLLKAANCCQRFGDPRGVELAWSALEKEESATTLRGVARVLYASGDFERAAGIVNRLEQRVGTLSEKDEQLAREVRGRIKLLTMLSAREDAESHLDIVEGRSVYFLHFSLPYSSVGYATRSHGLIAGMQAAGYDVRAYTRCGFPFDSQPELEGRDIPSSETIDGIEYRRLFNGRRRGSTESEYLLSCAHAYEQVLREERPAVVHAASNYVTALPALIAARRLGLPFFYEIRGFWEITRSSRNNDFENSARFSLMRNFEGLVARQADHVFTLTSAMKEELVRRGVSADKITLVHNGVDPERFLPMSRNAALAERLGLPEGVPVIGYVGSFVDYEGLDSLIAACGLLARRGLQFRLLMVGDGAEITNLRKLAAQEGIEDRVLLPGRVPHGEVEAYYSLVDICPFPRKPWEVCEMVSPLKPFEAMAMEKAVIVSSTHALREIVQDGYTGLVFEKGSPESLASCLERLLLDPALRSHLAQTGRAWALSHRTWRAGGRVVVDGFRAVLASRNSAGSTPDAG